MDTANERTIQTYSPDGETVLCMKCQKSLKTEDVAMFIRSDPADAFSAWCPTCVVGLITMAATELARREGVIGLLF